MAEKMTNLKDCGCDANVPLILPKNRLMQFIQCAGCKKQYDIICDPVGKKLINDYQESFFVLNRNPEKIQYIYE
jgi:hypothetical protein